MPVPRLRETRGDLFTWTVTGLQFQSWAFTMLVAGTREVAQCLRVLTTLAGDSGSDPRIHIVVHTHL